MKIPIVVAFLETLLILTDAKSISYDETPRLICYFDYTLVYFYDQKVDLDDIDAPECTHLLVSQDVYLDAWVELGLKNYPRQIPHDQGILQQMEKLKAENPDLKVIIDTEATIDMVSEHARQSGISEDLRQYLGAFKNAGFDGYHINWLKVSDKGLSAEQWCAAVKDFKTIGVMLSTSIEGPLLGNMTFSESENLQEFKKVARCSDFVQVFNSSSNIYGVNYRKSTFNETKTAVDKLIQLGIPPNKIVITAAIVYTSENQPLDLYKEEDPMTLPLDPLSYGTQKEVTASLSISTLTGTIHPDEVTKKTTLYTNAEDRVSHEDTPSMEAKVALSLNNSSLIGTTSPDEVTEKTNSNRNAEDWIFHEDIPSMEAKAKYVLEKELGGMVLENLIFEDIGGEGKYPLIDAVYNTFKGIPQMNRTLEAETTAP